MVFEPITDTLTMMTGDNETTTVKKFKSLPDERVYSPTPPCNSFVFRRKRESYDSSIYRELLETKQMNFTHRTVLNLFLVLN